MLLYFTLYFMLSSLLFIWYVYSIETVAKKFKMSDNFEKLLILHSGNDLNFF